MKKLAYAEMSHERQLKELKRIEIRIRFAEKRNDTVAVENLKRKQSILKELVQKGSDNK